MTSPAIVFDQAGNEARIELLRQRGVQVWGSERVFVANDVPLDAISPGAVLMNAIISGQATAIGAGSVIGTSGMARLHDACLGNSVELGAGTYEGCVLFDAVKVRGFAEIRSGTVLEEKVRLGHNVGLKNSVFTCWTTAGSCINFCDVIVSGGTGELDHSEIGSGAVHFNFSPRRDKFASCFGGPCGLLLRAEPIFIGGNTGIVAPCELAAGEILPAGTTLRQFQGPAKTELRIAAALRFIRMLDMIRSWYEYLRLPNSPPAERLILTAAIRQMRAHRLTRIRELNEFVSRRDRLEKWNDIAEWHQGSFTQALGEEFLQQYAARRRTNDHIAAIQTLPDQLVNNVGAVLTPAVHCNV